MISAHIQQFFPILLEAAPLLPEPEHFNVGQVSAYLSNWGVSGAFQLWMGRIGGIIAFIGAIKFALSIKTDDSREMIQSLLIMVSGFMIVNAVQSLGLFEWNASDDGQMMFEQIMNFIKHWVIMVGSAAMLFGGVQFGFAIKDENPAGKLSGLKTLAAGAICISLAGILTTFVQ